MKSISLHNHDHHHPLPLITAPDPKHGIHDDSTRKRNSRGITCKSKPPGATLFSFLSLHFFPKKENNSVRDTREKKELCLLRENNFFLVVLLWHCCSMPPRHTRWGQPLLNQIDCDLDNVVVAWLVLGFEHFLSYIPTLHTFCLLIVGSLSFKKK